MKSAAAPRARSGLALPLVCLLLASAASASAGEVGVTNGSFEEGAGGTPAGWTVDGGGEAAQREPDDGERYAVHVGGGDGEGAAWRSEPLDLVAGGVYEMRVRARYRPEVAFDPGAAIIGPAFAVGVMPLAADEAVPTWRTYRTRFVVPEGLSPERRRVKLSTWGVAGEVDFDRVEVLPLLLTHAETPGGALGVGERIAGGRYGFRALLKDPSWRMIARPLESARAAFHDNRWRFEAEGDEVVYAFDAAGAAFESGELTLRGLFHARTDLAVLAEVSRDGRRFFPAGKLAEEADGRENVGVTLTLPAEVFPCRTLTVRLRADAGGSRSATFLQVTAVELDAALAGEPADARGGTTLAFVRGADPRLTLTPEGVDGAVRLSVGNATRGDVRIAPTLRVEAVGGETQEVAGDPVTLAGGATQDVVLPYEAASPGLYRLAVDLGGDAATRLELEHPVSSLRATGHGGVLAEAGGVALWTTNAGRKVARENPVPAAAAGAVRLALAGNEAEAAQLIVRPDRPLTGLHAAASPLSSDGGATLPASAVEVLGVGYVDVEIASDEFGAVGRWPDPLPPLDDPDRPLAVEAGHNQPLWVRVTTPAGAAPGVYRGSLTVSAEGFEAEVPLEVEVFGFDLPDRPAVRTMVGSGWQYSNPYHRFANGDQRRQVRNLYLDSFERHRVSPYFPVSLDNFTWEWTTDDWRTAEPVFDWERWDASVRRNVIDRGFNTFMFPVAGLGGGNVWKRKQGSILGHELGTPEHEALFARWCAKAGAHLEELGVADRAVCYAFDEPRREDWDYVKNQLRMLKEHLPQVRRMVPMHLADATEAFTGLIDFWCPVLDKADLSFARERQAAGDEFGWYVCFNPQAPYVADFIDRGGVDLRLLHWQTWDAGLDGVLIWEAMYWTSDAKYPDTRQNPYADSMSWDPNTPSPWKAGDGRFLYPPRAAVEGGSGPVLDAPVDTIRWEALRDGVEDFGYFALLRDRLAAGTDAERAEHGHLLRVPEGVSASLQRWTKTPEPLLERRLEMGRALTRIHATR